MKLVHETKELALGVGDTQFETMGLCVTLSSLTERHMKTKLHKYAFQVINAVGAERCMICYKKATSDTNGTETVLYVPVGYVIWATVSAPMGAILQTNVRQLSKEEMRSGDTTWVLDICTPYNNRGEVYDLWEEWAKPAGALILHKSVTGGQQHTAYEDK